MPVAAVITPLLSTTGKTAPGVTCKATGRLAISRTSNLATAARAASSSALAPVTGSCGIHSLVRRLEFMRLLAQTIRMLLRPFLARCLFSTQYPGSCARLAATGAVCLTRIRA